MPAKHKRPGIASRTNLPVCEFCKNKSAPYSCPSCNSPYCSIACFRSEEHSSCSERFYRDSLLRETTTDDQQKLETLRMLKRVHEDDHMVSPPNDITDEVQANQEEGNGDEEPDEDERLAQALSDVDLETASPEQLLQLLGNEQRSEFMSLLQDNRQSERLLHKFTVEEPWWERPFDLEVPEGKYMQKPTFVESRSLPALSTTAQENAMKMQWNIVLLLLAYIHVIHSVHSTGADPETSLSVLKETTPFLFEKSTLVLEKMEDAITSFSSHTNNHNPSVIRLYISDLVTLISPRPVTVLSSTNYTSSESPENHSNRDSIRSLSHLASMVEKNKRAYLKVLYYISLVKTIPSNDFRNLTLTLNKQIDKLDQEISNGIETKSEDVPEYLQELSRESIRTSKEPQKPTIEELT